MSIGITEVVLIAAVVLLLFGRRLGRFGYELGRLTAQMRKGKHAGSRSAAGRDIAGAVKDTAEVARKVRNALRFRRFPF
jgi:Sec-independent protein translocase protein TatA